MVWVVRGDSVRCGEVRECMEGCEVVWGSVGKCRTCGEVWGGVRKYGRCGVARRCVRWCGVRREGCGQ